ncbi:MAG: phage portal protein, partial [Lachnospirales bacterium]
FIISPKRRQMINGYKYYVGEHDIIYRKITAIGEGGELTEVTNLPNERIVNNQYGKLVDQKVNYLLGKQIVANTEGRVFSDILNKEILNSDFDRLLLRVGEDTLNCGIGWLFVGYDENGNISFKRLNPWEVIPGWRDAEHTELDYAIRIYDILKYEGKNTEKYVKKVEVYESKGISKFILDGGNLIPDGIDWQVPYFYKNNIGLAWNKIPLVVFKANSNEVPLLNRVKGLQDALNIMISTFANGMQESPRNCILVLKNYDGENLGEFRRNLATFGAVKVRTADGSQGGVDTLNIEVNSDNYKTIIDLLKKSIIENAMGYDAKDDRLGGNANQMNIQSMYSDIDLDANKMESEFQASLQKLMWFIKMYLSQTSRGNYDKEAVEFIFNRDILINESEVIDNCAKSRGILSDETIVAQHPWVNDIEDELKKIENQKQKDINDYSFPSRGDK